MWKAYKYVFYRIYCTQLRRWGKYDFPQISAIIIMTFNLWCLIGSFVIISYAFTGVMFISTQLPKIGILVIFFLIFLLHYFLLVNKGKYKRIIREFKGENQEKARIKGILVRLYEFGSVALLIFLFMFFGIWGKG